MTSKEKILSLVENGERIDPLSMASILNITLKQTRKILGDLRKDNLIEVVDTIELFADGKRQRMNLYAKVFKLKSTAELGRVILLTDTRHPQKGLIPPRQNFGASVLTSIFR